MNRIFSAILLVPVLLSAAQKANIADEPWYELIKEVKFSPAVEKKIDALRKTHKVAKLENARTVKNALPPKVMGVYNLDWGSLNAGFAVIEDWRDSEQFHVAAKAVTNGFISGLRGGKYRVRDWVYSVGDAQGVYPHFFEQHIEEGTYRRDRWNLYDHQNRRIYGYDGERFKEDTLKPFSDNYLSILYNIRSSHLKIGDTLQFPTYVHDKNWDIKVAVLGRETITVPAGTFKTIKVQPILVGNGAGFNQKDKMYLWLTDDTRRILVLGKAKARVGHIYAKLNHLEVKP